MGYKKQLKLWQAKLKNWEEKNIQGENCKNNIKYHWDTRHWLYYAWKGKDEKLANRDNVSTMPQERLMDFGYCWVGKKEQD